MAHPLEAATAAILQTELSLKTEINRLKAELRASEDRESVLIGKLEATNKELADTKDRSDYYLRWNVEIIRQLNNIGMFVDDAIKTARLEVSKGNGVDSNPSLLAVDKALADARSL